MQISKIGQVSFQRAIKLKDGTPRSATKEFARAVDTDSSNQTVKQQHLNAFANVIFHDSGKYSESKHLRLITLDDGTQIFVSGAEAKKADDITKQMLKDRHDVMQGAKKRYDTLNKSEKAQIRTLNEMHDAQIKELVEPNTLISFKSDEDGAIKEVKYTSLNGGIKQEVSTEF